MFHTQVSVMAPHLDVLLLRGGLRREDFPSHVWNKIDTENAGVMPFETMMFRSRRPYAASFIYECLCPVRGHCVPGKECPKGEHVDSSMCRMEKSVTYPADFDKLDCDKRKGQCKSSCAAAKAECNRPCELLKSRCAERCRREPDAKRVACQSSCEKEKNDCDPENPIRKSCNRHAEVECQHPECNEVCELQIVRDLSLKKKGRRVFIDKVGNNFLDLKKGTELLTVDDNDSSWRSDAEDMFSNLDWSKPHTFSFKLPSGDCGPGSTCCSMGATRDKPSADFIVNCPNKEVCKDMYNCDEISPHLCRYQVQQL